ncbi:MAG TPA: FecR domain-containing protein, partial [Chitinophagaceae bacterium]|nr:FecR domain-containing protein [Chitinophagaceae bacterium]
MGVFTNMHEQQLEALFQRFINKTASDAEKQAFFELLRQPGSDEILQSLAERYPVPDHLVIELAPEASGQILAAILDTEKEIPIPAQRVPFIRRYRFVAAACFILLAGLGSYRLFFHHNALPGKLANTNIAPDIKAPQTNRATITLSTGQRVYLDSVATGNLAQQGGVKVVKLADGLIAYNGTSRETGSNTLSNPRGSKVIDITLADGSQIWLNAGSTITYPIAFTGNNRKVSMTGEAYFEVAHNPSRPFIVSKGGMEVEVLGTHFNINAYDDDKNIQVTLLKGSVKVNKGPASHLLKPGEQAQVG